MIALWSEDKIKDYNTRLAFQLKCEKADEIRLIAADFYNLYVDGNFVGYGPAKTAAGYARVDVYDLSKYENFVITVEALCYNIPCYSIESGNPLFGAEVVKGGKVIADSESFSAYSVDDYIRKTQKYSFQRGFSENYAMEKDRKDFYLGLPVFKKEKVCRVKTPILLARNVDYADYRFIEGEKAEYGEVKRDNTCEHWYESWQMELNPKLNFCFLRNVIEEFVSDTASELIYTKKENAARILSENTYYAYKFPTILVGFFAFEAEVIEDCELYLIWAEYADYENGMLNVDFSRDSCCDVIKFKLKKGKYSLKTFEPYCAMYAKIVCLKGTVKIDGFKIISFENADKDRVNFTCENKNLEEIVAAAKNTLAHNAVDVLTDCPGRERAGWLCDSYFIGKTERLLFGDNKVEKNFLENYSLYSKSEGYPEGMLPMCYPSDVASRKYIPNWTLWLVLELKDYLDRTGDREPIDAMRGKIYDLLDYFRRYENDLGLLENLKSWVFVEWSKANEYTDGVNFPTNMLYSAALKSAGELYGDDELVAKSERNFKTITEYSFNGEFFADNALRDASGKLKRTDNISETNQYYALFFGLANGDGFKRFRETMLKDFGYGRDEKTVYPDIAKSNAFIGNYLRLSYLYAAGEYFEVLKESEQYFTYMAKRTGTLWEHNDSGKSLDHGFASYAACLIIGSLEKCGAYKYEIKIADGK